MPAGGPGVQGPVAGKLERESRVRTEQKQKTGGVRFLLLCNILPQTYWFVTSPCLCPGGSGRGLAGSSAQHLSRAGVLSEGSSGDGCTPRSRVSASAANWPQAGGRPQLPGALQPACALCRGRKTKKGAERVGDQTSHPPSSLLAWARARLRGHLCARAHTWPRPHTHIPEVVSPQGTGLPREE